MFNASKKLRIQCDWKCWQCYQLSNKIKQGQLGILKNTAQSLVWIDSRLQKIKCHTECFIVILMKWLKQRAHLMFCTLITNTDHLRFHPLGLRDRYCCCLRVSRIAKIIHTQNYMRFADSSLLFEPAAACFLPVLSYKTQPVFKQTHKAECRRE